MSGFTNNELLYPLTKGDETGHKFHGNQHTGGIGGAPKDPNRWQVSSDRYGSEQSSSTDNSLTEEQDEKWGENSQNITGASAKLLGLKGFRFDGSSEDEKIASNYLSQIKESGGGDVLWSGHNMTDEQLSQYQEGKTVVLPLTATTSDKSTANTYTVGGTNGAKTGGNEVLMRFTENSPRMDYTDIEKITAGNFEVKSIETAKDDYWGTKITVITFSPKA
jgi:hypothetical protein